MHSLLISPVDVDQWRAASCKCLETLANGRQWARLFTAVLVSITMLGCVPLNGVLGEPARKPADFALLVRMGTVPSCHRREESPSGDPPIDPSVRAASYSRYSSHLQSETSIADQQRECREYARLKGYAVSPDLEFVDEAISGTKRDRAGLNAMLAAAEAGQIDVLFFHSLSRLSRESVITLPLLKTLVHKYDVRIVSVSEGIDSQDTSWELISHVLAIVHQQYLKELAANVLRGQEGAVLSGFAVGDHCFGYASEPIPGSQMGRRGRNAKPRKLYVVDPESAAWVERIFHWFVGERRPLRWIARELNRLGAPKDHRATTRAWRHQYLPRLLQNRKYVGWWSWGRKRNVRDPLTGRVRQKDRTAEECGKWVRHFSHLQLIDEETFNEAERLLDRNADVCRAHRRTDGTLAGSRSGAAHNHPCHLLAGLVHCQECGSAFHVGGSGGKYLFCPAHAYGGCSCQTQLRRDRAEKMILDEIGRRILSNSKWRQTVLAETVKCWRAREAQLPGELATAQKALADVERRVSNLLDRIENGENMPELSGRLAERRAEKAELNAKLERLRRVDAHRKPEPTEAWVDEQLRHLGDILANGSPAAAHALRDLVGGRIVVTEIRQPDRERHYLQGRFTMKTGVIVAGLVGTGEQERTELAADANSFSEEVVIDFREPPEIDALAERAKELYDQGLMNAQIAKLLGCSRSRMTAILKHWFASRGMEMPDGRSRRASLAQKHLDAPLYQRIANDVMALVHQGKLLQEVAKDLEIDRNTVTASIRWWHAERGMPIPDGRTRRKGLQRKASRPRRRVQSSHDDIAAG